MRRHRSLGQVIRDAAMVLGYLSPQRRTKRRPLPERHFAAHGMEVLAVGQVWEDADRRFRGRRVRIVGFNGHHAVVDSGKVKTRVRINRLVKAYRRIK